MVVAPGMPSVFWSSWSTRSEQHTARYIAGEIDKVIEEIERDTTAETTRMRGASARVQGRRPNVVSGGCSAHVLNLLVQDVCQFPAIKAILSRAVTLTRFIRDHLALLDEFKQLKKETRESGIKTRNLVLPMPTRWYSVHACMRSVLNSQDIFEKLFLSPEYDRFLDRYRGTAASRRKLRYITELIRDNGFWSSLRTVVRLLDPIITALRALETDNMFVSGVYWWFRWLRYHSAYGVTSPDE
ncbi:hypothetical protein PHYSODRAFT_355352 [Phytophthora sojae]|uniref:Uncharacterized protein n=1 Tax=Phytophthora sojae (strain P6497) TaxID=1094619 RepID=G5A052_PHYSP|nr:hypothetical protein PHYSODRAFT_355352 [Phytophthora sojae]EGZ11295.1 hypothetical protein PHYSODRAFT_355352 [Phytophthora sojae]|eukprot:XP_009534040.1 hypothetical protein PHYSODRAFT_355352 [Phytophthora sojae]